MNNTKQFSFDGGAGTFLGTQILAVLVTVLTLGIAYPFALVLMQRWKAKHTYLNGKRLKFTGTGIGLFGNWIKWFILTIITLGIYGFWVMPRIIKWTVEHTEVESDIPAEEANNAPIQSTLQQNRVEYNNEITSHPTITLEHKKSV